MKPFTHGKWHAWQGQNGILLSDEYSKKLHEFKTVDDCINWLYISGFDITARALNQHIKEPK